MNATVKRLRSASGNRDHDYFQPQCSTCNWKGAPYSNRTVEGRTLAERDAEQHRCRFDVERMTYIQLYARVTKLHDEGTATFLLRAYPTALPLVANGWTIDAALNHVQGVCDIAVCGGDH